MLLRDKGTHLRFAIGTCPTFRPRTLSSRAETSLFAVSSPTGTATEIAMQRLPAEP
ncbi:hypothetical protein ACVWYH_005968 [Bradyrhizobium sp. GM24.11]